MQPEESPQDPHRPEAPPPRPPDQTWEPFDEEGAALESPEQPVARPGYRSEISLTQRQIMGMAGGVLLMIGVFLPIVSVPVLGTVNVVTANVLLAGLLILVGGYSAVRALKNDFRFLAWNAYGALIVIGLMGIMVFANTATTAEGTDATGMEEAMLQASTIEWGWVVLLLGAFLLIATGHVNDDFRVRRAN